MLKSLYLNTLVGIKLLCNTSRNTVKFHTVKLGIIAHIIGHFGKEITHAHTRFKDVSALKSELRKRLINSVRNVGRRVKTRQRGRSRRLIFFGRKKLQQFLLLIFPPRRSGFTQIPRNIFRDLIADKRLLNTAPAHVFCHYSLFLGSRETVLCLNFPQGLYCFNVGIKS